VGRAHRGLLRLRELPAPGDVICAESGAIGYTVRVAAILGLNFEAFSLFPHSCARVIA
jgi:hypothetical protein